MSAEPTELPWEIFRCDDPARGADEVCGIRTVAAVGTARPDDLVVRETDRDECLHRCVNPAVARHIVELHNAALRRSAGEWRRVVGGPPRWVQVVDGQVAAELGEREVAAELNALVAALAARRA